MSGAPIIVTTSLDRSWGSCFQMDAESGGLLSVSDTKAKLEKILRESLNEQLRDFARKILVTWQTVDSISCGIDLPCELGLLVQVDFPEDMYNFPKEPTALSVVDALRKQVDLNCNLRVGVFVSGRGGVLLETLLQATSCTTQAPV